MSAAFLIWCPFPDEDAARRAVAALLAGRLIACGNLVPGMVSLFAWQGETAEARECGVLLKTRPELAEDVMQRLAALHPYDTPAITGWTVTADPGTQAWIKAETDSG